MPRTLGFEINSFHVVPLDMIRTSPIALRAVDKENESYLDMVTDVTKRGVLEPVTVRIKTDLETQDEYLELCDGLHRFSAATDAGLDTIPVSIKDLTDAEVEETQLVLNIITVQTKPMEVAEQIRRMLGRNPTMTENDIGDMISKSGSYVSGHLGLNKLDDAIKAMVSKGDINVSNAIQLSKLPKTEQHDFTTQAQTDEVGVFQKVVKARLAKIRADAKAGRPTTGPSFIATAHVRKLKEIESANLAEIIGAAITPEEAAEAYAKWVVSLDPATVAKAEAKWNANEAAKADKKKKDAATAAAKKLKEAREKAAAAKDASGLSDEEIEEALAAGDAAEEGELVGVAVDDDDDFTEDDDN